MLELAEFDFKRLERERECEEMRKALPVSSFKYEKVYAILAAYNVLASLAFNYQPVIVRATLRYTNLGARI